METSEIVSTFFFIFNRQSIKFWKYLENLFQLTFACLFCMFFPDFHPNQYITLTKNWYSDFQIKKKTLGPVIFLFEMKQLTRVSTILDCEYGWCVLFSLWFSWTTLYIVIILFHFSIFSFTIQRIETGLLSF